MDLLKLGKKIDSFLKKEMSASEALEKPSAEGAAWAYVLNDNLMGYISLENLDEMEDMPLITVSLSICDVAELSWDELLEVLEANSDLLGACFCVPPFIDAEGAQSLAVQARIPADEFKPEHLMPIIDGLLVYAAQTFASEEDDIVDDEADFDEEDFDEEADGDKADIPF